MNLSNINYQDVVDLFVSLMAYAVPIGLIWGLLERLVIMFYDAVLDRTRRRTNL